MAFRSMIPEEISIWRRSPPQTWTALKSFVGRNAQVMAPMRLLQQFKWSLITDHQKTVRSVATEDSKGGHSTRTGIEPVLRAQSGPSTIRLRPNISGPKGHIQTTRIET